MAANHVHWEKLIYKAKTFSKGILHKIHGPVEEEGIYNNE